MNKVEDGSGVRGDHRLHHQLAVRVHYRHRNRALVDIEAQLLHTFHRVFLSSARLTAQAQQPQPTRFYNAWQQWSRISPGIFRTKNGGIASINSPMLARRSNRTANGFFE